MGAVIDSQECEERLWKYRKQGTEHFYLMEISADIIIDAGRAGNIARFINHSCAPNLIAQKWKVKNGKIHIHFPTFYHCLTLTDTSCRDSCWTLHFA